MRNPKRHWSRDRAAQPGTRKGVLDVRPGDPPILWDWTFSHLADIGQRVEQHLILTGIAVGIGFVIAFLLSLAIRQLPVLYSPITWVTGVLYSIPSLALFALLIPFTGLSIVTAEIGLISYTLLILIRNIVSGVRSVPPDVRESAVGMGYSQWQMLWHIELPLATPVIIAGLRVAVVTTIGLVTVTGVIGQGGLGALILQGIQQFFATPLIIGAVLSIVLAVVLDGTLVLVQRAVTPWTRASR
jgi:osmoprotectant transport system permease protein